MKKVYLLLFAAVCSVAAAAQPDVDLQRSGTAKGRPVVIAVRGGAAEVTVVVPEKAAPSQAFAAQEFVKYVAKMTGVTLPIAPSATNRAVRIVLDESMPGDDFTIVSNPREVVVRGGVRGVLYGTYELVETYGGVGWYASWHEVVPTREAFVIPDGLDRRESPAFELREPYWHDNLLGDFPARQRITIGNLKARHGGVGKRFVRGLGNCHTFNRLLPPGKYFKEHPEYYGLVKGARQPLQPCLTNPEVLAIVTSNVLAALRADPRADYVGVSQNDCAGHCECEKCAAIDKAEDTHAGSLIAFVNAVAEAVDRAFPGKVVETPAYQGTRKPPKHLRARPNVMPCLCSIECDFGRSLAEGMCPANVKFRDDMRGWAAQTDRLYVWDYVTAFQHYLLPFPDVKVLQPNLKFFRECGVKSVFNNGAYGCWHAEFAELKAWLTAKWMWNPDADYETLVDRFMTGYYGKAAPLVRAYFDELESLPENLSPTDKVGCYVGPGHKVFPDGFFLRAVGLWRRAEKLVADDPAYLYNVRTSAMPAYYGLLMRDLGASDVRSEIPPRDSDRRHAAAKCILDTLELAQKKGRRVALAEHAGPDAIRKRTVRYLAEMPAPRDGRIEEGAFNFYLPDDGKHVAFVDDPLADDGKAFVLRNTTVNWSANASPAHYDAGRKYQVTLRVRVDKTATDTDFPLFEAGIYDPAAKKSYALRLYKAKDVKDGYAWYTLITDYEIRPSAYMWFSSGHFDRKKYKTHPGHNGIYVDCIAFR